MDGFLLGGLCSNSFLRRKHVPSEEWERHEGFKENWWVPGSLSGSKANSVEVGGFGSVMLTPRGSESHALSLEQE